MSYLLPHLLVQFGSVLRGARTSCARRNLISVLAISLFGTLVCALWSYRSQKYCLFTSKLGFTYCERDKKNNGRVYASNWMQPFLCIRIGFKHDCTPYPKLEKAEFSCFNGYQDSAILQRQFEFQLSAFYQQFMGTGNQSALLHRNAYLSLCT